MSQLEKMQKAQAAWNLVVQTNTRPDLTDQILGVELQIIEALRLAGLPPQPPVNLTHRD